MEYKITRVSTGSLFDLQKRPSSLAYHIKVPIRTFDIETHMNQNSVEVDVKYVDQWGIQINSVKDIQKLIEEVGEIIINEDQIIIYDDYIE